MVLNACTTSASIDIESATSKFKELSLSNFPGEDISAFIILALKYIKVMKGVHSLPPNLATDLLLKFQDTETEIFNRNVITHYFVVDELETQFTLKDQTLMIADSHYESHGPVGCRVFLQAEYGKLFAKKRWKATTSVVPEGNLIESVGDSTKSDRKRAYYKCRSLDNLHNVCLALGRKGRGGNNGNGTPTTRDKSRCFKKMTSWKYDHPNKDDTTKIVDNIVCSFHKFANVVKLVRSFFN